MNIINTYIKISFLSCSVQSIHGRNTTKNILDELPFLSNSPVVIWPEKNEIGGKMFGKIADEFSTEFFIENVFKSTSQDLSLLSLEFFVGKRNNRMTSITNHFWQQLLIVRI